MNQLRAVVMVAGLGFGGALLAQEPAKPPAPQPEASAPEAAQGADRWIRDLGSESYRARLQAEKELRQLGAKALPQLKEAAAEAQDHEVQWRARRLVRQIESGEQGLQQRHRDETGGQQQQKQWRLWGDQQTSPSMRRQFEELFREMEQQFGLDIPRARFFHDDFFKDLQDQMQADGARGHGMSLQIGPDGAVRAEVKETDENGKVETKVYEAPDMETFQQQYPDVLGKGGLNFGLHAWPQDGRAFRSLLVPQHRVPFIRMDPLRVDTDVDIDVGSAEAAEAPPEGKRLGIIVRPEIPAELREHLEIEEGVGLMVQEVQSGTLAETLGLRQGDIVVRIADRQIRETKDVQEAIGGVEAGAQVEVHFLRKGVEQSAKATKPEPKAESKDAEAQPKKANVLQRRKASSEDSIR